MQHTGSNKSSFEGFPFFRNLLIQQKLPLFICLLLLFIVTIFAIIAYVGIRHSEVKQGTERLDNLTRRLSSMFEESAENLLKTASAKMDTNFIRYLKSDGVTGEAEAYQSLQKAVTDSLITLTELRNRQGKTILHYGAAEIATASDIDSSLSVAAVSPLGGIVGQFYPLRDSVYYPVILAVKSGKQHVGYFIKWQKVHTPPERLKQFSGIVGTNASMYMGNQDLNFWTDLMKPIAAPPLPEDYSLGNVVNYLRPDGEKAMASIMPVKNTGWILLVEFDMDTVLSSARSFLWWILAAGAVLILIGMLFTWLLSRNITSPLNHLTMAASSIAQGDYSVDVGTERKDELGKLARAFRHMAEQVEAAQNDLEQKVMDRTARLESVNKELEAFSYSVSHDLRAPLRAINGYSVMLKEDYNDTLDAEGQRILNAIMNNARQMGALIDDLIAFSGMSRKTIEHSPVDMTELAEKSLGELHELEKPVNLHVSLPSLPHCFGDQSMIKQVWVNLLSNAIKYSSRNASPRIEIGASANGDKNIYFIKDNGVGFDMKYAHKLFGVFQRLHSASEFQGTGIGLALAQRIINKHNGQIWAEAEPGKGATFFFSLPKVQSS